MSEQEMRELLQAFLISLTAGGRNAANTLSVNHDELAGLVKKVRAGLTTLSSVTPARVAQSREAELQAEIERLRGLMIDPGNPAWEDARSVLVAELRKAEMPNHARSVANGEGAYIPSWMALNLIAHAALATTPARNTSQIGEG